MSDGTRTALLIIHGIGQQEPFDTIDAFAGGLLPVLRAHFGADYRISQREVPRQGPGAWEAWQQYYLAFDAEGAPPVDLYEHYWAYRMTGRANLQDIVNWLDRASDYARRFYRPEVGGVDLRARQRHEGDSRLNRMFEPSTGRFHDDGYLRLLGFGMPTLLRVMMRLEKSFVSSIWLIDLIFDAIVKRIKQLAIDYVGDLAVYTETDRLSPHFGVRQQMLLDARLAIEALLADGRYGRVIVAGHSLGSVIAYDAINRLHKAPPLTDPAATEVQHARLTGLVTFGCPLDKTHFFYQQRVAEDQALRAQMLDHLHSFMRRHPPGAAPPPGLTVTDETSRHLSDVAWLNFYDRQDPISGHLDAFDAENIRVTTKAGFGIAHNAYWDHAPMHEVVVRRLLPPSTKSEARATT